MQSIGRKCDNMNTMEYAKMIRTGEVKVYGPRFTKEGADGSSFEEAKAIGVVRISQHYSGYLGVVVATPAGPQVWMAEGHFCRSHVGRILLLEDSISDKYLEGEVITWGDNLSWMSLTSDEEELEDEDEDTKRILDV